MPVRVAARSVTGSGNLREGGSGAPGVPQPVAKRAAADRAAHPNLDAGFIALPVYWSGARVGTFAFRSQMQRWSGDATERYNCPSTGYGNWPSSRLSS
ncbi:MAG: hypothetical protein ABSG53_31450, partial [Thermoguttaceae bacterium]